MQKWESQTPVKVKRGMVVKAVEKAFEPDIVLKLDNLWNITGFTAKTRLGAEWLLKNAYLLIDGKSILDVEFDGGITVEYNLPDDTEAE